MGTRERLIELGAEALSEGELLKLLLFGDAPNARMASELLAEQLPRLVRLPPATRLFIPGLTGEQVERLCAALELGRRLAVAPRKPGAVHRDARTLTRLFVPRLSKLLHEELWCVLLTAQLEELRLLRICTGGVTHLSLQPREALAPAILHDAACVVFAHNHPSGDALPSADDLEAQRRIDEAARALGIHVIDHLVITSRKHFSARDGLLDFAGEQILDQPAVPAASKEVQ